MDVGIRLLIFEELINVLVKMTGYYSFAIFCVICFVTVSGKFYRRPIPITAYSAFSSLAKSRKVGNCCKVYYTILPLTFMVLP